MKASSLITLSFLLLTSLPLLGFSKKLEKALDTDEKPLLSTYRYYIKPAVTGEPYSGGGVRLVKTGNSTCPVTILQDSTQDLGQQVTFFLTHPNADGFIFTGAPFDIMFEEETPECASSGKWSMFVDKEIGRTYIGIGGPHEHPGHQMFSGTFNLQPLGKEYKLVFCVSGLAVPTCMDIGRYGNSQGGRPLVLTKDDPFAIGFINATKSHGTP